jgi:hypothetical protein
MAMPMEKLGGRRPGRIVVALTQPYAALVGTNLAKLPESVRPRLRILGPGLADHLPESLKTQCMDYDARLDVLMPGTRLDAASRACDHFVRLIAEVPMSTVTEDQARIDDVLSHIKRPSSVVRPRLSDSALRKLISRMAKQGLSATGALRHLRVEIRVACEERRFRRLYEEVTV